MRNDYEVFHDLSSKGGEIEDVAPPASITTAIGLMDRRIVVSVGKTADVFNEARTVAEGTHLSHTYRTQTLVGVFPDSEVELDAYSETRSSNGHLL
jgi:hypothetical protein